MSMRTLRLWRESSSDELEGKYSLLGTSSNDDMLNTVMAAVRICASATRRKKSSQGVMRLVGSLTAFLRLIRFLSWYSVPPSIPDEQEYSRFQITCSKCTQLS